MWVYLLPSSLVVPRGTSVPYFLFSSFWIYGVNKYSYYCVRDVDNNSQQAKRTESMYSNLSQ